MYKVLKFLLIPIYDHFHSTDATPFPMSRNIIRNCLLFLSKKPNSKNVNYYQAVMSGTHESIAAPVYFSVNTLTHFSAM